MSRPTDKKLSGQIAGSILRSGKGSCPADLDAHTDDKFIPALCTAGCTSQGTALLWCLILRSYQTLLAAQDCPSGQHMKNVIPVHIAHNLPSPAHDRCTPSLAVSQCTRY